MLNVLNSIESDYIYDFVDDVVKKAFIDSFCSGLSGWHKDLILTNSGELYLSGDMCGSILMSVYEGTSVLLYSLDSQREITDSIIQDEDVNKLSIEDRKNLYSHIATYENIENGDSLEEVIYNNHIDLDSVFCELFNDYYLEKIDEYKELEWEVYGRDRILDDIFDNISSMRVCLMDDME